MKPKSSTSDQVQGPLGPSSWQVVPCCSLSLTSQHLWVPCSPGFPFRFWEVLIISLSPRASCLPILLSTITIFLFNWQTGLSLTFFSLTTPTPAPRMRWRRRPSPLLWSFFFFWKPYRSGDQRRFSWRSNCFPTLISDIAGHREAAEQTGLQWDDVRSVLNGQ